MATMAVFLWGRWRHDLVAMGALLVCVFMGLVPGREAFAGFGHPAVITVACVLVLSYGLQRTGAVDGLAQRVLPASAGPTASILALISLAALLSGFMNNVAALALLMPIAIQLAAKQRLPAGKVLMPLAFGSILGGMTTLIGTPPNLIVSGYRAMTGREGFALFDFAPVGVPVAVLGVVFVGLVGWRLVPTRKQAGSGSLESVVYLSEVRITETSKAANKSMGEAEKMLDEADAQIVAMIRHDVHIFTPNPHLVLRGGDILIIEVTPESLPAALASLGLQFGGTMPYDKASAQSGDIAIQELVVTLNSALVDQSATGINLRTRHGITLLAISRQGRRTIERLRFTPIQAGDVLLMQGTTDMLSSFAAEFGCLPLATRDLRTPKKGQALTASLIMAAAVGVAVWGLLPPAVSFAAGVLAFVALGVVPMRAIYTAVEWPVIVLLGAMLPVADAMATTGTADLIARFLLDNVAHGHVVAGLGVLLVVTILLSSLMNNTATAAAMCPIAISTAHQLGVNVDTFLMAIAVGASCSFLTPISHQNNTLILGPGGFHFGDYWRLGLALEIVVVALSIPMLLWVWPL